ncbi:Myosin-binding protein H [Myotis brandtii]|uniref:Myosin-binding protein H n=1 Tax=Myotis brandtii TaxID=109478 RepID=S7QAE8_MYOBR|nr:Myosin-binding protein H [Myotis brandtii]
MTATSQAPDYGPEEPAPEVPKVPTEPSGEGAALKASGEEQAPAATSEAPAPAASQAPDHGPEEPASEVPTEPTEPTEPSGEGAASELTGEEQAPTATPEAPAPEATKPAPRSEDVPSVPLQLTIEDVSDCSVTVSWEPPERLGSQGLQGYLLELRKEGGELWAKPRGHQRVGLGAASPRPHSVPGTRGGRGSACPQEVLVPQLQGAPE